MATSRDSEAVIDSELFSHWNPRYAEYCDFKVCPIWWIIPDTTSCACGNLNCGENSKGKHPIGRLAPNGFRNATDDPATIETWWFRYPDANIAAATGDIVVVDKDPRNGGHLSLKSLIDTYGPLPTTWTSDTGGGGNHFIYKAPSSVVIRSGANKLGPGLDIRARGPYILLPPSTHRSGRNYAWAPHCAPWQCALADLPPWLLILLITPPERPYERRAPTSGQSSAPTIAQDWHAFIDDDGIVPEGERNDTVARLTGHLLGRNIDAEQVHEQMQQWNQIHCSPPLDADEVTNTVNSIAKRELARGCVVMAANTSSIVQLSAYQQKMATQPQPFQWPDPTPLPEGLAKVDAFDLKFLPRQIAPWVGDTAERMACPPEYVAIPAMVGLGALIGNKIGIRPSANDDWTEVPNLWGLVIGRPGTKKTPAWRKALAQTLVYDLAAVMMKSNSLRRAEREATQVAAGHCGSAAGGAA
jgi:hypothetical protein